MTDIVKAIVKKDRDELLLFFPGDAANYGKIVYWAELGGHGEAAIEYYWGCGGPSSEEAAAIIKKYERCYGVQVKRVWRQTYKQRMKNWRP